MNATHVSGALRRPTLVDYLIVAEQDSLDLSLRLYVGALEVGLIGIETGRLVYADLPGATGDLAISLLSRLPSPRVVPEAWASLTPNIHASWRDLVDGLEWDSPLGRSRRLVLIRAELRELDAQVTSGLRPCPGPQPSGDAEKALAIVTELLDWAWENYFVQLDENALEH